MKWENKNKFLFLKIEQNHIFKYKYLNYSYKIQKVNIMLKSTIFRFFFLVKFTLILKYRFLFFIRQSTKNLKSIATTFTSRERRRPLANRRRTCTKCLNFQKLCKSSNWWFRLICALHSIMILIAYNITYIFHAIKMQWPVIFCFIKRGALPKILAPFFFSV